MTEEIKFGFDKRTVTDCNGATVDWLAKNGDYIFLDVADELEDLATFQFQDDDVMLVNYPKSGTHWVWEMMQMIRNQSVTNQVKFKESAFLELAGARSVLELESPRYFNSHLNARYFPTLWKSNCKVIYTYRNPKDVAVSDFHHTRGTEGYDGNFAGFLGLFLEGKVMYNKWSEHLIEWQDKWQQHPDRFLVLAYEDIQQDPAESVRKIAEFLEIPTSPELCEAIADSCHFDKMKPKNAHEPTDRWRDHKPMMYRKGKVGDWRNHFTVAQDEAFDAALRDDLKRIDLEFKFTLNSKLISSLNSRYV